MRLLSALDVRIWTCCNPVRQRELMEESTEDNPISRIPVNVNDVIVRACFFLLSARCFFASITGEILCG